tara:strand:+ start:1812 stop:2399 length:588 start_codon:yes stop_codon:yes gene_type:complete
MAAANKMFEIISITVSAALVHNIIFVELLGLGFFFSTTSNRDLWKLIVTTITLVLVVSSSLFYLTKIYLLDRFALRFLDLLSAMIIVSLAANLVLKGLTKLYDIPKLLYNKFLFLVILNSGILYIAISATESENLLQVILNSFLAGFGFSLSLICFNAMHERILELKVPHILLGSPIILIMAGIVSLAFMGFIGL